VPVVPTPVEMADTEIDVTKFDTVKAELEGAAGVRDFMSVAAKYMDEQSIDKALFAEGASLVENRTKLTEQIAKAAAGKGKCPTCKGDTTCAKCDKAEKGDVDGDVAKVAGLEENITKLSAENDVLKADVVKLTGEIEALKKLPAPTKAVRLQVVTKSDDGGITGTESEQLSGPILKSDGSIDEEATCLAEIKKVHASAPIRFKR
jgi:cell division protein FtsB